MSVIGPMGEVHAPARQPIGITAESMGSLESNAAVRPEPGSSLVTRGAEVGIMSVIGPMGEGELHATGPSFINNHQIFYGYFGGQVLFGTEWTANDWLQTVRVTEDGVPLDSEFRTYALAWPSGSCGYNSVTLHAKTNSSVPGPAEGAEVQVTADSSTFCDTRIVIGTTGGTTPDVNRSARFYINDTDYSDSDSDGLGNELELQLGTCPYVGHANCTYAVNPADTDGDGLTDLQEVRGHITGNISTEIPLPRLGASPLKKDVFVEVDWTSTAAPMSSSQIATVASVFANDINYSAGNPDGSSGFALHIDSGTDTCDIDGVNCSQTYGDWGGAGVSSTTNYKQSALDDMELHRRGIFLHALATGGGGGQAAGIPTWRFGFGVSGGSKGAARFAHELGHALGLDHGGGDAMVCKPNYPSLMNYAWTYYTSDLRFSRGLEPARISTELDEELGTNIPLSKFAFAFDFDSNGQTIDWNRNGTVESTSVRGVTRWAKSSVSCASVMAHGNEGMITAKSGSHVALAELDGSLFAFSQVSDLDHTLQWSEYAGDTTPCDANGLPAGCCPTSVSSYETSCVGWTYPSGITTGSTPTSSPAAAVMTLPVAGERILLVYRRSTGTAGRYYIRTVDSSGNFGTETQLALVPNDDLPDPALVVWGSNLFIYYVDQAGDLRQARVNGLLQLIDDVVLTEVSTTNTFTSEYEPAVAVDASTNTIMLVRTLSGDYMELLRRTSGLSGAEFEVVTTAFPTALTTGARPALTYNATNEPYGLDLWYVGSSVSALRRTWMDGSSLVFKHDNRATTEWSTWAAGGTSLTWFEGQLHSVTACAGNHGTCNDGEVLHLPIADGIFPFEETDYDDFDLMRNALCGGLKKSPGAGCGICVPPNVNCVVGSEVEVTCPEEDL